MVCVKANETQALPEMPLRNHVEHGIHTQD